MSDRDRPAPLALVVEDEALLILEIEDLLMAEGFTTLVVCTEATAKAIIVDDLAVAVVDLHLAGELAGKRIIHFLRCRTPNLPVVVITGYGNQSPEANLRGLGWPTIRLHKPVQHAALARAVWDVIDQARTGTAPPKRRRRDEAGETA